MESNIIGDVESELKKAAGAVEKILPRDLPSDTREVAALAQEAASTVEKIDPALSPLIDGLESAFKTGVDSLNVLREKIDALKSAATVKTPVVTEPEPVDPAPAESEPATTSAGTEPASTDPTPPVEESTSDEVDPPVPSEAASSSAPATTEASAPVPAAVVDDAPTTSALAIFKTLTPAEQAQFLADLAAQS